MLLRLTAVRAFLISACALILNPHLATAQAPPVAFSWFEYTGRDAAFDVSLPPGHYRNPILAGFHPDPAITRAGGHFYLVNSSFAYFPGIPVYESSDLVHWKPVGNVIQRPSQLRFDGLGVSRGVFAPDIAFHDGMFYVIDTAEDAGGNFMATSRDPAGPWSDPQWLQLDGIDPSLFFDRDGRAYVLNNGPPPGRPRYAGHRAIWIQELDLAEHRLVGPRTLLVDGGVKPASRPIWIEGPHLYARAGWYYLLCAEGGTGMQHSEVVLRSRSLRGPFQPYAGNPILTQRDLPPGRPEPVINAGHADLVEAPDGTWWAVFLGSRAYGQVHYNTGRETFLLPVQWQGGWPVILKHGRRIPAIVPAPRLPDTEAGAAPTTGNFTWRDEFDAPTLRSQWLEVRAPQVPWADLHSRPGWLTIHPLPATLDAAVNPSFLARRQQHLSFDASTELEAPTEPGVAAGLAAFQSEHYWYFLGVHRTDKAEELFLEADSGTGPAIVARMTLKTRNFIKLRISGDGGTYAFLYDEGGSGWKPLEHAMDGTILSTDVAGGFVGTMLGPYARTEAPPE